MALRLQFILAAISAMVSSDSRKSEMILSSSAEFKCLPCVRNIGSCLHLMMSLQGNFFDSRQSVHF